MVSVSITQKKARRIAEAGQHSPDSPPPLAQEDGAGEARDLAIRPRGRKRQAEPRCGTR